MFEAHVLHLLRRYLGEYVHGLSTEALRISVWKGDVVLKDLKLKAEALNSLKLPVTVKGGFVGTITLKVPWKSLGKEPVIVLVDRVFILACPAPDGRTVKDEDREKLFEAKLQQIEDAESATLEAIAKSKLGSPPSGNSWLGSVIATIIGNLKISISNVHIRYEDSVSNPEHPFAAGITLAKLAAVTMDEQGNETFDTSGALDKLRKSLQLERLAVYHDSNSLPWEINKKWEVLSPEEWVEIFEEGIKDSVGDHRVESKWALNRQYLLSPINGALKYHRLGNQERNNPEIPFEKASVVLTDVNLTITEEQYYDWIKLLEVVSRYRTYIEISHLRPITPVSAAPNLWWRYAAQAGLQQKKMCYRFSWDRIQHLCKLRRRYIQLYAALLQQSPNAKNGEMKEIEMDLDSKVILLWRLLAHAKVESMKSKEAAEQKRLKKGSWFSFRWRTQDEDDRVLDSTSENPQLMDEELTKEEWLAINNLLSHQPDEETVSYSGKDMQNMIYFLVTVSISKGAARIISVNQTEILCGRFEQLDVTTKFKCRSTHYDLSLRFYGLSAPEGSLAQSVSSEQKANALVASFVKAPVGENIDWRLSATISPCHVTVWTESWDRVLEFVKRSHAVSPSVALETATALQMRFEKVTRRAQEQFQAVLEVQSRFALDIDLDAPKVRIPLRSSASSKCDSHFLLDFGHFTLTTMDWRSDEQRQNLYSRFHISGRDIAAFFTDCGSNNHSCSLLMADFNDQPTLSPILEKADHFYSLIDRCGVAVIVDQIKVPHPSYPSTRISIQVPNLGVHFSPTRYIRLMELFNNLYGVMTTCGQPAVGNNQEGLGPWSPADLARDARILVWKGIGNSVATWQPCFLVLSGLYLYTFESDKSKNYQRYLSMAGRQVLEVPHANVGGSRFCVAVGLRGMDLQKALESSSTWVIEFHSEEEKTAWLRGLVQATYQASAHSTVDVLGHTSNEFELHEPQTRNSETADLVINGAIVETRLYIYGKTIDKADEKLEENILLEVLATGGKVHIISSENGLTVRMKLHSLKIKDEIQHQVFGDPQYLAYSVLKNDNSHDIHSMHGPHDKEASTVLPDDEDSFKDALPEFFYSTEPGTPKMDMAQHSMTMDTDDHVKFDSARNMANTKDAVQPRGLGDEVFYEAQGGEYSDFVSVVFLTRSPGSHDYNGIDTQMSIRMSKLEFFCNRPTIVALIGFGFDMSAATSLGNDRDAKIAADVKPVTSKEKADESWRVEGLLGYGKDRVVFHLSMDVDSVTVFLNKEDGSQLAMFVQERFLLDIKVHPSSLSIEGTLGNLRLRDVSLGTDNRWGWLCDIRHPGVESLIKFKFNSYSAGDDDYEGYDYSLSGRLSAVRIVFLYRFVQEITVYFMGLATPHTEEAVKLVDKVGGFEWLVQKYEMEGATAVKLDLSLDTPTIVVPRNSYSEDFIQLDLGQLEVANEISWYGCPDKDPGAVRVDVLHAKILGINMSVGINGCIGKPMIREGQGLDIFVRRSLRDVFKKVSTFALEVKIDYLHGVISDKEYDVIVNCTYMNLCEEPKLPPDFRGSSSGPKDTMRLLVDKVNLNSQMIMSRTVTILAVEVNYALLELHTSIQEGSPLAHVALEGLWVSYRMTSLSETDLYVSIPRFSVLDIRPNTKPEMRLMLGSAADAPKQSPSGTFPFSLCQGSFKRTNSRACLDDDAPCSTMLLMDYRWRKSSQSFVVRVQQPRILAVPDFLLAVGEFFVPALRAITGRDETMDPKNDVLSRNRSIVLSEPVYKQTEDIVHLSPCRQLVVDSFGVDEYIYDGCGKVISLSEQRDVKHFQAERFQPIIVIGRGKKLRFINVKIENGSLLSKYVYLSNESSYSVSPEDEVDISLLEISSSNDVNVLENVDGSSDTLTSSSTNDSNQVQSYTFEAQVVSPEFTFYDGTKSSLDDSSYGEKLLRAKMDFSFMYASKENDIWVRALLKDLTVETGSGLIILNPVDISGGYTSVKEKTNMSLISTDIYLHLSLSALSLLLNLQSQVTGALQSGNATPVVPCTNFDRIWVSPKENGPQNNLTIWRPQAPSNYVILGDCVTSRSFPPTQAVMAVSNTYGRVRKPIGFTRIGLFSVIQGLQANDGKSDNEGDCSLWMPVAPAGYAAMGCVANLGIEPPPDHVVYCLRSDLISSTTFSECIFSVPSNRTTVSGFSIWRVDNVLGSFYAHSSTDIPSKMYCSDLGHCLIWNPLQSHSSPYAPDSSAAFSRSQQANSQNTSSSGWDIVRSVSKANKCYVSTPNFEKIWWDKGGENRRPISIWRPIPRPGFAIVGDCITEGLEPPALGILLKSDDPEISARPVQFTKVAHIAGKGFDEVFFWYPIAPPGYVSLGCVVSRFDEVPLANSFCCPRMDLVNQANIHEAPVSRFSSSKSYCWSIWKVENQACTFLARSDLKKPSSRLAYAIGDSVKPKTRENVTAEMKLRCFSLTILDGLHGMMTPLFDTTITNIKLATHGRTDAMNAVLISSIAASAFNPQLEAWEPLVEPFDGIFKLETYDTGMNPSSKFGKRVRIAATNILNINISAASLETVGDAILSWRRQLELEKKAVKTKEDGGMYSRKGEVSAFSALDEDDFQTIIVENMLGCDIHLKKLGEDSGATEKLGHGDQSSVWIPPPRFSDRLNYADGSRETRNYITIQILEAKGLHIVDDGNSHNIFCALRLVLDGQGSESQKLFPQSARTKCVKPSISVIDGLNQGYVKWNELFIFEIPRKGSARLEVEVTNLAAKAGKGEVVGAISFPVGRGAKTLKKVASVRMLHQPNDVQHIISYPLQRKTQNVEDGCDDGCLFISSTYFERDFIPNVQRNVGNADLPDRDTGFWIGTRPDGSWQSIRSLLPLSVVPKLLQNDYIAMEVLMQSGKKHAIFRALATVINDTDISLEISISSDQSRSPGTISHNSSIIPGSSSVLPWRCLASDSEQCLHVRPRGGHSLPTTYAWGYCVAVSSGCGKDQPFVDQGLLTRQNSLRQGSKQPTFSLKLNQLEKKDMLFCCQPSTGSRPFWLTVGTDASILHTDLNMPVYDWKIGVSSPLTLENRLPCTAKFTLWEKTKEGTFIERQCGIVSSRKSAHIYSVDIQRPVYLTLAVDGGWTLERDPVLLLDLSASENISSFWLVHQQSKRRLRVSIERDMGETGAAPKTLRFFVPYWITNDSYLPLAYRVVEIEPSENLDMDSLSLSGAVKSTKLALKNPVYSMERKQSRRNIQVLEVIEDTSPIPSMLSPQESAGRSGVNLFSSQKDSHPSPKIGIAVAVRNSDIYSPGISLLELEKKERVDVRAFCSDASYYKLSVILNMTSDRTKVIHLQPHTLFINRVGISICLQHHSSQSEQWIHPSHPPKHFAWQSSAKVEFLKLRVDGYNWSTPFSVVAEGLMRVSLVKEDGGDRLQLRVQVRSGTKNSRYEVIFRPDSISSPYRIENRSMFLPIRCRQVDGSHDSWQFLPPATAASFYWEDLGRRRLLELLADGADASKSEKYDIDEIADHLPKSLEHGPVRAIRVTIFKEEKTGIVRISDWMPAIEPTSDISGRLPASSSLSPRNDSAEAPLVAPAESEYHLTVELPELGVSFIDHAPEEILYMSVQSLFVAYSTGLGSGLSRFKVRMQGIQVDNQLPLAPMPVLFRTQKTGDKTDHVLKFSITLQSNASLDLCVYPYIGLHGPENTAFLINIHEPIIWRIHEMIRQANLTRLYDTDSKAVSVDPFIQIGVLNISEIRFKVSMAMSPSQRPRGVLGFWSSLMTALGNTENMPVRIGERFRENVSMRRSTMISNAISNIKKDLLGQPLQLLSGVDILGNASSALGHMSKGMAALSMDKKFIQGRQRQDNKGVEDFGDIIREGGGALAKGLFRGVTGILTKPLEGAKSSGVEGFVSGFGKGIIGAAAQPVSGVLDLLSKTTEGANAMRMKIAAAITSDEQLLRRRLPRVIGGDNLLRPYNDYKAQGQVILHLAESGSFFGQVDLFKVRGKFALTDAYEDHFMLPKCKILMVTHRRVILLQQPSNIMSQRKFIPAKDPCSIMWYVLWSDLVTMELTHGKKDQPKSPPSRLFLYLKTKVTEMKEQVRVIKCSPNTHQALEVYSSIEQASQTYGQKASKETLKHKVTRPYAPKSEGSSSEGIPREGSSLLSPQQMPSSVAPTSTFGGSPSPG